MDFDNVTPIVEEARAIELPLGKTIVTFNVTHCDVRSPAYIRIKSKLTKPVSKLIEVGMLSKEKDREIAVKSFVEYCVVGWSGVMSKGVEVPFSREAAVDLLCQAPSLFYSLTEEASDADRFKPTFDDVGN